MTAALYSGHNLRVKWENKEPYTEPIPVFYRHWRDDDYERLAATRVGPASIDDSAPLARLIMTQVIPSPQQLRHFLTADQLRQLHEALLKLPPPVDPPLVEVDPDHAHEPLLPGPPANLEYKYDMKMFEEFVDVESEADAGAAPDAPPAPAAPPAVAAALPRDVCDLSVTQVSTLLRRLTAFRPVQFDRTFDPAVLEPYDGERLYCYTENLKR